MKRLISEEEIKISNPSEWCKVSDKFFISADFAEENIKNIAIGFAEWYYNWAHVDGESTIKQQFEYFIERQE